jgi:glycosyltransferase involved in cell wall biosynthesis
MAAPRRPRILYLVNVDWFFWTHRLPIARAVRDRGGEVWVAAAPTRFEPLLAEEGFRFVPVPFNRSGRRVDHEARTFLSVVGLLRSIRPDLVHNVTIKPVLYGSLAARLAGRPAVVNAIPGLGYVFLASGGKAALRRGILRLAYRPALSGQRVRAIFQNPEDAALFAGDGLVGGERAVLIRGSGVDVEMFRPSPEPRGLPTVLMASRMLWDKGVGEFVEAAIRLRSRGVAARFVLAGDSDPDNPSSVPRERLAAWHGAGTVEWWGHRADMPSVLSLAHVVCLPSYREGLPKVLLEAAAAGRPIVTTDVPGCREVVRHGENGYLVPPRDPGALAAAIRRLVERPDERSRMGAASRSLAESEFRVEKVVESTLSLYGELLGERFPEFFPKRPGAVAGRVA